MKTIFDSLVVLVVISESEMSHRDWTDKYTNVNTKNSFFSRYMKYLYPYECFKRKLSSPSELQSAIDGNRRDSRRTYGTFGTPPLDTGYSRGSPPSSMAYSSNHSPGLRPSPGPSPTGEDVSTLTSYRIWLLKAGVLLPVDSLV